MMSNTIEAQNAAEIHRKSEQRSDLWSDVRVYEGRERAAEDRAEELRSVARNIDAQTGPLRQVFLPIRGLHTATTWEGNAATQSRTRLDIHESRTSGAITTLDALVDDLYAEATRADADASSARASAGSARWSIGRLTDQINGLAA